MDNFFSYILESSVSLAVLYTFYLVFLKRDKFLSRNRFYLVLCYVCALSIPFINITPIGLAYDLKFETLSLSNLVYAVKSASPETNIHQSLSYTQLAQYLYFFITGLFFILLLMRFSRLFLIISRGSRKSYENNIIVTSDTISAPFSFFKFIFLNPGFYDQKHWYTILCHERGHIELKHSLDIVLAEIMKILLWFNPIVWMMRRSLAEVHEYQADAYVLDRSISRKFYQNMLFKSATSCNNFMFVNSFHGGVLKRRILMLQKQVTKPIMHLKLAGIIPIIAFLLSVNSAGAKDKPFVLPIDHGKITSGFGQRLHPISKQKAHHNGIDIGAPKGTPITAIASGIVIRTGDEKGPGKFILLQHDDGWHSFYSQLEIILVNTDQKVIQGEHIGDVGSSGISTASHLHFELHLNAEPVDPELYLNFSSLHNTE